MKTNNAIVEIAIFTVKQESINQVSEIRSRVKESLQSFKGFISINALYPVNSSRVFADIALWETLLTLRHNTVIQDYKKFSYQRKLL